MSKKIFSCEMSENVLNEFNEHVSMKGYTKYRALEAAMRAFIALPSVAQVVLMSPDAKNAFVVIEDAVRDIKFAAMSKKLTKEQMDQLSLLAFDANRIVNPDYMKVTPAKKTSKKKPGPTTTK